jgi:hypothetical protein
VARFICAVCGPERFDDSREIGAAESRAQLPSHRGTARWWLAIDRVTPCARGFVDRVDQVLRISDSAKLTS